MGTRAALNKTFAGFGRLNFLDVERRYLKVLCLDECLANIGKPIRSFIFIRKNLFSNLTNLVCLRLMLCCILKNCFH